MRQYSPEEIRELIEVSNGNPEEQAAAIAVVLSAITESRRLGRVAVRQSENRWQRERSLRSGERLGNWGNQLR